MGCDLSPEMRTRALLCLVALAGGSGGAAGVTGKSNGSSVKAGDELHVEVGLAGETTVEDVEEEDEEEPYDSPRSTGSARGQETASRAALASVRRDQMEESMHYQKLMMRGEKDSYRTLLPTYEALPYSFLNMYGERKQRKVASQPEVTMTREEKKQRARFKAEVLIAFKNQNTFKRLEAEWEHVEEAAAYCEVGRETELGLYTGEPDRAKAVEFYRRALDTHKTPRGLAVIALDEDAPEELRSLVTSDDVRDVERWAQGSTVAQLHLAYHLLGPGFMNSLPGGPKAPRVSEKSLSKAYSLLSIAAVRVPLAEISSQVFVI
jgi:hypothetical protein